MSKKASPSPQAAAKVSQGYEAKPRLHVCMNCERFACDKVDRNADYRDFNNNPVAPYWEDTNLRCTVGGVAVKKMGSCRIFVMAEIKEKTDEQ